LANPELARLLTAAIGDGWITDLNRLRAILPLANDSAFRDAFRKATRDGKLRFASWLKAKCDEPSHLFSCSLRGR
jgi:starch phosphorylase